MSNVYGGDGLFAQEYGFDSGNDVMVARLYYSFPIGENFTVVAGPRVRMDDMLPVWPSAYPSDMTYDFFTYAGAPGAYNLALGAGAGVIWKSDSGFSISTSYLSTNGNKSCPSNAVTEYFGPDGTPSAGPCYDDDGNFIGGGIGTDAAGSSATTQIAYAGENWGVAAAYTYNSNSAGEVLYQGNATQKAAAASGFGNNHSYGVSAWWMPEESGLIPSISAGFDQSFIDNDTLFVIATSKTADLDATLSSWYVGLEWDDVFIDGNSLGFAAGQPTWVSAVSGDDESLLPNAEDKPGYAFELFYKFQVTDNITVTPALTYLTKPFSNDAARNEIDAFSGLIKTSFKF